MNRLLLAGALAACLPAVAASAESEAAPPPALTLEQKTLLRCSGAFAIIAHEQAQGVQSALAWPALGERGREYFVQSAAQLMDELGLTEQQVDDLLRQEAKRLQDESAQAVDPQAFVNGLMQPCLMLLDASGI